jgi:hypothetical protein
MSPTPEEIASEAWRMQYEAEAKTGKTNGHGASEESLSTHCAADLEGTLIPAREGASMELCRTRT